MMTDEEANYRSLAASGAFYIALTGIAHEMVGPTLFPWAPAFFGPVIWHGLGAATFILGALILGGTLRKFPFPVVPMALLISLGAGAAVILVATRHEFHFLAFCVVLAGLMTAFCHRKTEKLRAIH